MWSRLVPSHCVLQEQGFRPGPSGAVLPTQEDCPGWDVTPDSDSQDQISLAGGDSWQQQGRIRPSHTQDHSTSFTRLGSNKLEPQFSLEYNSLNYSLKHLGL